jgi:putative endonuclease
MGIDKTYWVYLLASGKHGTLYAGVTNSLERRIAQHKTKEIPGFTATYAIDRLVWFQGFGEVTEAIHFEKQLKRWRRDWKVRLIEQDNPNWQDLYPAMTALPPLHPDLKGIETACHPGFSAAEDPQCHPGFAAGEDRYP